MPRARCGGTGIVPASVGGGTSVATSNSPAPSPLHRSVAAILGVVFVATLTPGVALAQPQTSCEVVGATAIGATFADVAVDDMATIGCIVAYGIAAGTGRAKFSPSGEISRAQMATFLVNTAKSLTGQTTLSHLAAAGEFADIAGDVHEANIRLLAGLNVTQGTRPGKYDPSGRVTRGQLATFVLKTWTVAFERTYDGPYEPPPTGDHFIDDHGDVHENSINVLATIGIARGWQGSANTYEPGRPASRLEMAQFLAALLDWAPSQGLDPVELGNVGRQDRIDKVIEDASVVGGLLDEFWSEELWWLYEVTFDPPDRLEYYFNDGNATCGGHYEPLPENAYYCGVDWDEHVGFDMEWLQKLQFEHPTGATTYFIIAHEWGHAVQDTLLDLGWSLYWNPPHRQELNADCLAGAFFAGVTVSGELIWEEGDLEAIFDTLIDGGGPWMDSSTHGSGIQRLAAFEDGWQTGAHDCLIRY